jgi:hypothetical protein
MARQILNSALEVKGRKKMLQPEINVLSRKVRHNAHGSP